MPLARSSLVLYTNKLSEEPEVIGAMVDKFAIDTLGTKRPLSELEMSNMASGEGVVVFIPT